MFRTSPVSEALDVFALEVLEAFGFLVVPVVGDDVVELVVTGGFFETLAMDECGAELESPQPFRANKRMNAPRETTFACEM